MIGRLWRRFSRAFHLRQSAPSADNSLLLIGKEEGYPQISQMYADEDFKLQLPVVHHQR
jgi:hypothetical protein